MPAPDETRRVQRIGVKIPLKMKVHSSMENDFTLTEKEQSSSTVDMSATGMGIMSGVYIPDGVLLEIELDGHSIYPDKGKAGNTIKLTGEVVSSRMLGGLYRLGILVKEINEADKNAILKFIESVG